MCSVYELTSYIQTGQANITLLFEYTLKKEIIEKSQQN